MFKAGDKAIIATADPFCEVLADHIGKPCHIEAISPNSFGQSEPVCFIEFEYKPGRMLLQLVLQSSLRELNPDEK